MHVYVFIHTCRIMYIYIYTYLFCVGIEALFLRGLNLECPLWIVNVRWLHFGGQKINLCLLSSILRCFGGPGWWQNCCTIASKGWGQEIGVSFFVFQHPKPSICVDSPLRFFLMYMHVYVFIHTCRIMYIYIYIFILCRYRGVVSERFKLRMPFVNCEC